MDVKKYKEFSERLIDAMKSKGYTASRSPRGICIQTLSKFAGASEQICRRYLRGDALPDYEKVKNIAQNLSVSAGWLLFGEQDISNSQSQPKQVDEDLLHYILTKSHHLYQKETGNTDDYADFVLGLIRDVRKIHTSRENIQKIIDLALDSISSYEETRIKNAL